MAKEIALTTRQHTIVGEPRLVGAALDNLNAQGRLVGRPSAVRMRDGQVKVTANITEPTPHKSVRQRWSLWSVEHEVASALLKAGAFALVVLAVIVGVLTLAGYLLANLVMAIAAYGTGAALVAALIFAVVLKLKPGHRCSGIHCSGCKG